MDPPPGEEGEFDAWYAEEHVPLRMKLPGFLGASRARAVQGEPSHLVVYWLQEPGALETPEYQRVKAEPSPRTAHMLDHVAAFTRFSGEEIGDAGERRAGRYLYLVTFSVPEERKEEFDAWYEQDHVPLLLRHPSWVRCRRYAITEGVPEEVTRAAVHEIDDLAALASTERQQARESPWRLRLAEEPWFGSARYAVYERFQEFAGSAG